MSILKNPNKNLAQKKLTSTHDFHFGKEKSLLIFRIFCLVFYITDHILIFCLFDHKIIPKEICCALTCWGLFFTMIYFLFVVADYILDLQLENFLRIYNFMMFSVEFLISVFFWTALLPGIIAEWGDSTPYQRYADCSWHISPIILLTIDTAWNKHIFNIKHLWVPILFNAIYGCVNASYT